MSFSGTVLRVEFSCLFTNYAFIYITQMSRVEKKTFLEKQQVKKKETIVEILPSCPLLYLYWYMSRGKQGVVLFPSPQKKDSSVIAKLGHQVPPFQW